MCMGAKSLVDQEILIFGSGTGRTVPLNTSRKLGMMNQASRLEFRVLEQVDLAATVTVSQGGRVVAFLGGSATDEIVGRELGHLKTNGAPVNTYDVQSSGALTLAVTAWAD